MRYQSVAAITLLAFAQAASAFNMADCVAVSQAEPYSMSADAARAACAAKNAASGEADSGQTADLIPTERPDIDTNAVKRRFRSYMSKGQIRVETCIGLCRNRYPRCPSGYTVLKSTAGPYINGAYHGRYWLRSAACLRNE